MPYIHLANGDVRKVTTKELTANNEQSGSARVWREDGMEHHVIGVYPEEYEHPESEEVLADKAKAEQEDRLAFEHWRAAHRQSQTNFEGKPL